MIDLHTQFQRLGRLHSHALQQVRARVVRGIKPVYAHCDVPCGIYETDTMTHAAATCLRMVEKYDAIGEVADQDPTSMNTAVRCIMTKEKHAQLCKDQLYLLWSDYFKPEHLKQFPELHELFWRATKQCGTVKRTMDADECRKLQELVHEVAHMFAASQK